MIYIDDNQLNNIVNLFREIKFLFQQLNNTIPKDSNKFNKQQKEINIYTDGSCVNNGQSDAQAGIGIYFGENDNRNLSKKLNKLFKQTNNVAELMAIIEAYRIIKEQNYDQINIYSDSTYAIGCCTDYGKKVIKDNKTNVPNFDLINDAQKLFASQNINFIHVKAHTDKLDTHSIGNANADKLANLAIGLNEHQFIKIYLKIDFSKKEYIKSMGGRWDADKKLWYIMSSNNNKDKICKEFVVLK